MLTEAVSQILTKQDEKAPMGRQGPKHKQDHVIALLHCSCTPLLCS